jgi:hypothetical protein
MSSSYLIVMNILDKSGRIKEMLTQGKSYREIQDALHVSSKTIAKMKKLSLESEGMEKPAETLGKQADISVNEQSEDWDIIMSPPGPKDDKFAWSIAPLVCLIKYLDYLLPDGLMVKVVKDDKLKLITSDYLKNSIFNLVALARQVEMHNRYGLVPSLIDAMNWTQGLLDKVNLRPSKYDML